jgi:hypothetical protein
MLAMSAFRRSVRPSGDREKRNDATRKPIAPARGGQRQRREAGKYGHKQDWVRFVRAAAGVNTISRIRPHRLAGTVFERTPDRRTPLFSAIGMPKTVPVPYRAFLA